MSDRRVFTEEFKREAVRLAKERGNLAATAHCIWDLFAQRDVAMGPLATPRRQGSLGDRHDGPAALAEPLR